MHSRPQSPHSAWSIVWLFSLGKRGVALYFSHQPLVCGGPLLEIRVFNLTHLDLHAVSPILLNLDKTTSFLWHSIGEQTLYVMYMLWLCCIVCMCEREWLCGACSSWCPCAYVWYQGRAQMYMKVCVCVCVHVCVLLKVPSKKAVFYLHGWHCPGIRMEPTLKGSIRQAVYGSLRPDPFTCD